MAQETTIILKRPEKTVTFVTGMLVVRVWLNLPSARISTYVVRDNKVEPSSLFEDEVTDYIQRARKILANGIPSDVAGGILP
jgi:hypothetical protein